MVSMSDLVASKFKYLLSLQPFVSSQSQIEDMRIQNIFCDLADHFKLVLIP